MADFTSQQAAGFICSLCLYHRPPPDEDASPLLTVINGQLVCVDHAGYVGGGVHSTALVALNREQPLGGPVR